MSFRETTSEISNLAETKKLDVDPDKLKGSEAAESKVETSGANNLEPIDADKRIEPTQAKFKSNPELKAIEQTEVTGGSYRDVKWTSDGSTHEVHHIPAFQSYEGNDTLNLAFKDGPAIKMEKGDHRMTASWGPSSDARDYRAKQAELIKEGNFKDAIQMDIDDIRDKFGDKYDDAIAQMLSYAKEKGLI